MRYRPERDEYPIQELTATPGLESLAAFLDPKPKGPVHSEQPLPGKARGKRAAPKAKKRGRRN